MAASPPRPPNIVVFLTDQQGASMLRCAGNDELETPAMDSIAASGTRFERAYCTNPVCAPSRFSLMTGRYPSTINLRSNDFAHLDEAPAALRKDGFGHRLREAGYETIHGGKFGVPTLDPADIGLEQLTGNRRDELADACVEYLRDAPAEPFFLAASFINPHDICYMAIRDYQRSTGKWTGAGAAEDALDEALEPPAGVSRDEFVTNRCPPLPANHEPQAAEPDGIKRLLAKRPFRQYVRDHWSAADWRRHRWAYCRLTERVDRQIGRVLAALEAAGLREETLIVFTSDHGDHDAAHKLEHKTIPYEEAARVPLLIDPPSGESPAGVVSDRLVSNGLDLVPTIADYAGIDARNVLPGRSLRPLVSGETAVDWRDQLRIEFEEGQALVTPRYKLVRYRDGENAEQLYDLETDPGETVNAVTDPPHPEQVDAMRQALTAQQWGQNSYPEQPE